MGTQLWMVALIYFLLEEDTMSYFTILNGIISDDIDHS